MNSHDLDTPCGYCAAHGRREIPGGRWLSAPECLDCGGTGYLIISPEAERLLGFLTRHLGHALRCEMAALRAELSPRSPEAVRSQAA
jgi:hypothetical protein